MPFYPQIATGVIAQYPIERRNLRRTIVNMLDDGSNIRMSDSGASQIRWQLAYSQLTGDEVTGIQNLFDASEGQLQTFTFLDPTDNLLLWSEDLTQSVWKPDALLQVSSGLPDPLGGSGAFQLTNAAETVQEIRQALAIPGSYQYCLSAYIRADQPATVQLIGASGAGQAVLAYQAASTWTRAVHSFQMKGQDAPLSVAIALDPGSQVSVYGMQLEAQLGAGAYKPTLDISGIYEASRFEDDTFTATATNLNQYSCVVRILSNVAG